MKYTYGTDAAAAGRLEAVARFFNPHAERFIKQFVQSAVDTALDLGCGPGFTTEMLARATGAAQTTGIDRSAQFLKTARARFPRCRFVQHDVTVLPLPLGQVLYGRFLLSHLRNIVVLVNDWAAQLPAGGLLMLEEFEDADCPEPAFREYLAVNRGLVASQGAELYVGRTLAAGAYDARVVYNECAALPVANSAVAAWFYPNTRSVWEQEPFVRESVPEIKRRELSEKIGAMLEDDGGGMSTWKLRRLVLTR